MANQKVTREDIERALNRFGGSVQAAAEDLDITRKALYERIKRLGLQLGLYRDQGRSFTSCGVQTVTTVGSKFGSVSVASVDTRVDSQTHTVPEPEHGSYRDSPCAPSLHIMIDRGATAVAGGAVLDLAARARHRNMPARLLPEQLDELQQIRLAYQAKHGIEITNSALLQQIWRMSVASARREILGETER